MSHDKTQEKPVHFVWQILQWSQNSIDKLKEIGIEVTVERMSEEIEDESISLFEVKPPENHLAKSERKTKSSIENTKAYKPDYIALQKRKTEIGELGEQLIFEREREYLLSNGRPDLAQKVNKMSDINDKVGYDILSFDLNGSKKLIEVKTTTGGKGLGFHISANEVRVSVENSDNYYIYRVFDFNKEKNTGKYYVVNGSLKENFDLIPTEYKATYNPENLK